MVKTKIIATLGPASDNQTILRKMITAGLDAVRLNFSHGTHQEHIQKIENVRALNKKMRRSIKIMQDLEGYRIRIGKLKKPLELKKGDVLHLTQEDIVGSKQLIPFDYEGSLKRIKQDTSIFIDDGKIALQVSKVEKRRLKVGVVIGGVLCENKGINIPGAKLDFEALTGKDMRDVKVAVEYKLDYLAQSFVRNSNDLSLLKGIVKQFHPQCKIFAKVESREALDNIEEIIDESDGIIVARGDLGICVPIYKVPVIQKEIIKRCRIKNKPVVVATQMLDSMTHERLPTRAETSDVANAILDGATHLLLSGETAVGTHPHLVIAMMNKIIKHTESYKKRLHSLLY